MNLFENRILLTDSYKPSHWKQYPPNTQNVYSYFESRGGKFREMVFFGLQYYLKKYFEGKVITKESIVEADAFFQAHFGKNIFNKAGWEHIVREHGGRLPVSIKAVPEGTVVPVGNVLMTIENTDPACYWLTNYLETLLVQVWYGSTVATQSREMKKIIHASLEKTGDPSLIDFKLHDFGFRGVSSVETAGMGGAAHLVNFMGTDTIPGLIIAREIYGESMAGFSIPAAEHSTITSWGKEAEVQAFENMLKQFPNGLVAVVSDSYDIFNACWNLWGKQLKTQVLNREGVLVVRPDSGNPPVIVPQVLNILGNAFGVTYNNKSYKMLHPKVRIIQGDGIDFEMLPAILTAMEEEGWSADNIAFGSGGGLLQKLNRDTQKMAFKCSAINVNGIWHDDISKNPITDPSKVSKNGRLKLVRIGDEYRTVSVTHTLPDQMIEVFKNGVVTVTHDFKSIKERAKL